MKVSEVSTEPRKMAGVEELAQGNPSVDVEQLRDALLRIEEMRRQGLQKPRYNLSQPYERRPTRRSHVK
jgi:hypothetical protein